MERYQQAVRLYGGDFLREDLYESWAQPLRDRLEKRYIRLLMTVAAIYEAREDLTNASKWYDRVLEVDSCLEEACRRLMTIYQKLGETGKAIETFMICKKAMRQHMDTDPDEATVTLYHDIQDESIF